MSKLLLRLILLFSPLFEKAGIDTIQLKNILTIKLLIDIRRPKGIAGRTKPKATTGASSWGVDILTIVIGCLYAALLLVFKKPLVGQTVYFSAFMVLVSLTLITDFTTVLIDARDQYIIAPRPVNDRTVAMARILHITIYVMRLALLQGFAGIVITAYIDGPLAAPIFLVQIIIATLLSIFFVNIAYLLLMKVVSPQRFKDIIGYIQIGFTILIFATYQLLPRLIRTSVMAEFDMMAHTWAYFLPPVWIASLNEVLVHGGRANLITSLMAILGITVPLVSVWFVAKVLAPGFNKSLAIISLSDGVTTTTPESKAVKKAGLLDKIANLIAPDPIENAGFRLTWKMGARSREFKMAVYPQFVFVPIYFVYSVINGAGTLHEKFESMQHGSTYIILLYLCSLVLAAVLQQVSQTPKYKAAWVYYALPIVKPGKILAGMFKAVTILYFVPYSIAIGCISVAIWGPKVINDVILAFFLIQIYGIIMALFLVKGLPFSRPVMVGQGGGRFIKSIFIMSLAGGFGFAHYILSRWEMVIWICIVPAILIYWLMLNYYKKQTWDNIVINEID